MTKEEKQLLLKDLCARLPYGVKVEIWDKFPEEIPRRIIELCPDHITYMNDHYFLNEENNGWWTSIKPYLRPMSSMTESEREELRRYCSKQSGITYDIGISGSVNSCGIIDYLNKKMFDYRGLIPMGLALEAPEGMYKM